ncbi:MAG: DUF2797 domain-containing protein [Venatoribacter sp.]
MVDVALAGSLEKMLITPDQQGLAHYRLNLGSNSELNLNQALEKRIQMEFAGQINCRHCQRLTRTSFGQGYCYPCFTSLAQCDSCMMAPEKCHYHLGTCREPEWGERVCFADHIVYLANSSGLKVGITRVSQMPTRWLDQGATQALPIARVASRRISGLLEDTFRQQVADRTSWQKMLKGVAPEIDLSQARDELFRTFAKQLDALKHEFGENAITLLKEDEFQFSYPVLSYPTKVTSHNFDKTPAVSGRLLGLKGQYLMLDSGVMNLRKFTSYQISFALCD